MSEQKIEIPNEVGASFTEAAIRGDKPAAMSILLNERSRYLQKMQDNANADTKYFAALDEIEKFRQSIGSGEAWNQCRRACGWNPDEPAEVKPAGPVVMRVEDLRKGDEIRIAEDTLCFEKIDGNGDYVFRYPDWNNGRWFNPHAMRSLIARGFEFYRIVDGVRTLISGWPADKHPAVEEAARLREENARLRARDDQWCSIATKYVEDDDDYPSDSVTSPFELGMLLDLMHNEIAGSELKARSAEDENSQLKSEIDRLKAAADEPENKRLRKENERLRSDLSWDKLIQPKFDSLQNELEAANSKLAAWINAANYTPNGTPLAKPVTDPDGQIARLKGMIEASEGLQRQLEEPRYTLNDILCTAWSRVKDDRYWNQYERQQVRARHLVANSIETLFDGAPAGIVFKLK